jgi:hypothetical protein
MYGRAGYVRCCALAPVKSCSRVVYLGKRNWQNAREQSAHAFLRQRLINIGQQGLQLSAMTNVRGWSGWRCLEPELEECRDQPENNCRCACRAWLKSFGGRSIRGYAGEWANACRKTNLHKRPGRALGLRTLSLLVAARLGTGPVLGIWLAPMGMGMAAVAPLVMAAPTR